MKAGDQSLRRHFEAASATVASLRTRKVSLQNRLALLDPAGPEWRQVRADLLSVTGALDRALPALSQRRRELEAAEGIEAPVKARPRAGVLR